MAEDKKSFVLYADLIHTVSKMPSDKAGDLFKHILSYVNDENPVTDDLIIQLTFEPIKQQLKRDLTKYEETRSERSRSGYLGNLKKHHKDLYDLVISEKITLKVALSTAKDRKDRIAVHSDTNTAVNDNVTVTVNVNDTVNDIKNNIINNENFFNESLASEQWSETMASKSRVDLDVIEVYLKNFKNHLIATGDQKKSVRDFKTHFSNWLYRQDLSQHRTKVIGKTNQVNYEQ